jgi:hypothetical protein
LCCNQSLGIQGGALELGGLPSGPQVTSRRSPWLHRRCRVCGHSFRVGDRVRIGQGGAVAHDMPMLRCCGGDTDADAQATLLLEERQFYAGLAAGWPMALSRELTRLEPGHPLLAPPRAGHRRASCRVCGHSFRPGDLVLICPCSPARPICRAAVHRDLLHQLHCWDIWQAAPRGARCIGLG